MINKTLLSFLFIALAVVANGQVEMADRFRSDGKIYIVIAVILVILAGFFFLLFKLDRKTKRLEEEIEDK